MYPHQSATPRDEFEEVFPALRLRHAGADIVIQEDGVETAQRIAIEHRRVFADDGLEGPRPLAEDLEGFATGQDRGPMTIVFEVTIENEKPARLERLDGRDDGDGLLKSLPFRRTRDERDRLVRRLACH